MLTRPPTLMITTQSPAIAFSLVPTSSLGILKNNIPSPSLPLKLMLHVSHQAYRNRHILFRKRSFESKFISVISRLLHNSLTSSPKQCPTLGSSACKTNSMSLQFTLSLSEAIRVTQLVSVNNI
ncbi:hypothetical protein CK203_030449 [Vitis vinifera]|uniref:Uncharacterized protein n=1 Tax=Vitis vinifera TaxID=29760 RepID=A0A438JDH0_VITVI|nr:hypothetical protein CK203_030449 [Vitis vinifera]